MLSVIQGDCLTILSTLPANHYQLVFADPPFNIGVQYADYSDNKAPTEYFNWCMDWIKLCWERVGPNGVVCLHGPDNLTDTYTIAAARLGMHRVARIVWHYRFAVNHRHNWPQSHCYCSVYAKSSEYTWNPDAVLVDSDRATVYNDNRIHDTERGGTRLPGTVWGVPSDGPYWGRVTGTSAERRPLHKNQLPEVYLKRLLLAYTNPGDEVLDPFGGSGTTITVATVLSRSCTTIELSKEYCESIQERLKKGTVR